jgi:hypothetical protein
MVHPDYFSRIRVFINYMIVIVVVKYSMLIGKMAADPCGRWAWAALSYSHRLNLFWFSMYEMEEVVVSSWVVLIPVAHDFVDIFALSVFILVYLRRYHHIS